MIEIKHLKKSYGTKVVIPDLNLTIEGGQICAFIGKNGSGKTTTLKSVVGIHPFDSGEILLDGISIADNPLQAKRTFGYIQDQPVAYEFMTGIGFLNFVADIFGISKETRKAKIDTLAKEFELEEALTKPIASYSHGMKQKIIIISSLMRDPHNLILDEPFVGLDPTSVFVLKEKMREIAKSGGCVFFSTHVLEVAEKLCDHVVILENGQIVRQGTMSQVVGDKTLEKLFLELEAE